MKLEVFEILHDLDLDIDFLNNPLSDPKKFFSLKSKLSMFSDEQIAELALELTTVSDMAFWCIFENSPEGRTVLYRDYNLMHSVKALVHNKEIYNALLFKLRKERK